MLAWLITGSLALVAPVPHILTPEEAAAGPIAEVAYDQDLRRAAIICERGLHFLATQLEPGGVFAQQEAVESSPTVAICSLGALSFMANGYTADSGPYMLEIRRCIKWLLAHVETAEFSAEGYPSKAKKSYLVDPGDKLSRMHGHGYATWALAMAYGMSFGAENEHRRNELDTVLQQAVHLIELAQTDTGGWGYESERGPFHEGSVTITEIQSLRAARDAGLRVNPLVIERAVEYVRNSQIRQGPRSGGFRYQLGHPDTSFALTAAAISTLNQTGIYDSQAVEDGLQFMLRTDPLTNLRHAPHRWYAQLYAVQAYWQYRDLRYFRSYYPRLVEKLAGEQDPDTGAFNDSEYGDVYATAMACLALSVPFGYLPSFQR